MKIALISDIHGNLPALKAVLNDIDKRNVDCIYCLGDIVDFAGWDNEVIDIVRHRNITCIKGNHDDAISLKKSDFDFSYSSSKEYAYMKKSIKYVNDNILNSNRDYLLNLPIEMHLNFKISSGFLKVVLSHFNTYLDRKLLRACLNFK